MEDKAALLATRSRDGASVEDDGILHDGKAESCAALLTWAVFVGAVEALKHTRDILLVDSASIVPHFDEYFVEKVNKLDVGVASLISVTYGVDYQVD